MRSATPRSWLALALVMALVAAGCGNRLSDEEILAQNTITLDQAAGSAGTGTANAGGQAGSGAAGATAAGGGTIPGAATGGSESGTAAPGAATGAPGDGGAAVAAPGSGAPIVIGLIGFLSGTGGETLSPARDAWVAWERAVNARGGINGHPVELLIGDYGGNASRAVAIARDFVENQGAIALTHVGSSIEIADYAASVGVPVIGTITGSGGWNDNPMLFPPYAAPDALSWATARFMADGGATRVASLYCAEASDCQDGAERFNRYSTEAGLEVVYQARYSVLAPDFTAECLELQRRGAQAVYLSGDVGSAIRIAQSCGRQGFRPTWAIPTATDENASIPEFEGAIAMSTAFPWFLQSGSPAIDEYHAALATYAPNLLGGGGSFQSWAWASAKLLELAAANVSEQPTSADILEGLWSMQGETLGGLVPPRTFTRDQPTPETFCAYQGRIQGGQWTAPQGSSPTCR
jgi:branched-chain amino acid transport system substrate-binding protein